MSRSDPAGGEGVQVVESYFDLAICPRPPRGVVLFAPCSFNSLDKLAHGIADNLALSAVAEVIWRGAPVNRGPILERAVPEPSRGTGIARAAALETGVALAFLRLKFAAGCRPPHRLAPAPPTMAPDAAHSGASARPSGCIAAGALAKRWR
jgi:hypothetical protein